ncbi:MAG: T9SS type A sorting domain-containing protein [Ignavibacteriae bacterium]|nr:T9SS type A sorting domain-containing protein [Ignavibacteriota bacterium]
MKLFVKFFTIVLLTNIALSQWELRTNYDFVRQFASDGNKMYIGRNNGMTVYDLTTKESENKTSLNSDLSGNYINTLMSMTDNTILISTNGGLAVIENGVITKDKHICTSYPDTDARDLYKDSSGNIWTFSSHKVHKYSNGVWKTFDLSDSIKYKFDLAKLFFHKDQCWALFNDNTKTNTVYYFTESNNERIKIAIIADSGIVRTFQSKDEFPYYDMYNYGANISLASANDDVFLKNPIGVYVYHDTSWSMSYIFDINLLAPRETRPFITDIDGNIWCIASNDNSTIAHPIKYDINSGIVTEYLVYDDDKFINTLSILDDGTLVAYSSKFIYFKNDTGWIKNTPQDFGIPDSVYFSAPRLVNGKRYVKITYSYKPDYSIGTLYCLDDRNIIPPIESNTPFSSIVEFGIRKDGKGIFKGRNIYSEPLLCETDSSFIRPSLVSDSYKILPCQDGNVYFNCRRIDNTLLSPILTTWDNIELLNIDMGFMDKHDAYIEDFDSYNEYLVSLGHYYLNEDSDSLNSFLSIYNTATKVLTTYDKYNSCMPDYYYERIGGFYLVQHDTVPKAVTIDNNLNVWIYTSESLIKFNPIESKIYNIPMYDSINKVFANTLFYDIASNELLADYFMRDHYYFFDIATEKWDSIPKSECGIIGWYITHKKLLDGRIWACDYTGYMYRYIGKGKFELYNLKINGREYLNFQINDFSIDANNYLHLGTDIGLLTNKTILTGVDDYIIIDGESISVYPNPAHDFIQLHRSDDVKLSDVEIYNFLGLKVMVTDYKDKIDVSRLSTGVYFIRGGDRVLRFVKM